MSRIDVIGQNGNTGEHYLHDDIARCVGGGEFLYCLDCVRQFPGGRSFFSAPTGGKCEHYLSGTRGAMASNRFTTHQSMELPKND